MSKFLSTSIGICTEHPCIFYFSGDELDSDDLGASSSDDTELPEDTETVSEADLTFNNVGDNEAAVSNAEAAGNDAVSPPPVDLSKRSGRKRIRRVRDDEAEDMVTCDKVECQRPIAEGDMLKCSSPGCHMKVRSHIDLNT